MLESRRLAAGAAMFLLGAAAGIAASKVKVGPQMFQGKAPAAAATDLLQAGETLAGGGSWEQIAIGRVRYLGGHKPEGQAVFDRVLGSPKVKAGDYIILPSVTLPDWKEQVGRSLIEGILCGCVALGSDSGHIPSSRRLASSDIRVCRSVNGLASSRRRVLRSR